MITRVLGVLFLLLLSSGVAAGKKDESDRRTRETFQRILRIHGESVVRISYVLVSAYGGQEQRQEGSVSGVVVDASGVVLVPKLVVEPSFPGMNRMTPEQRIGFKLETRDFRVHFAGHDQPFEAEAITTDPDQGIAWLRIRKADASLLRPVNLKQRAEAEIGMAYYTVERLEERYGEAPVVAWGVLQGAITVPQRAFVGTGAAGLAFDEQGAVLGYVSMDFDEGNNGMLDQRATPRMLMTPATRLLSATQRALTLVESESNPVE